jgi:uncharacterized membrane protein
MTLLIAGITLWFVTHLFPAAAPRTRDNLIEKLGENPYRGVFSLLILAALLMIIFGWKSAVPSALYAPPMGPGIVPSVLVLSGLVIFFSSQTGGHIKRLIRHPQMTGVLFWSTAHLLANGDSRSVSLFGGFALWAVLEIILINRREGPRDDRPAVSISQDLVTIVIGGVVFALVGHFHLQLFGVSVVPG